MGSLENLVVGLLFMFVIIGFASITFTGLTDTEIADELTGNDPKTYNNVSDSVLEERIEKEFRVSYKEYREQHNLGSIKRTRLMKTIAEDKSVDMARRDYIDHTSPSGVTFSERVENYDHSCQSIGENLALNHYNKPVDLEYGGTETFTNAEELGDSILEQYENIRGHRLNMEDRRWDTHGFDVVVTEDNKVYHTHIFCDT